MNIYKRLLLIINPHAGIHRKDNSLSDIILCFSDHGYETVVCFTREGGDATRLVEEHAYDDIELIVCMGGDGTLNEVITGCRKIKWNKAVGYIPAGSTNDFAASLGLSSDPAEAARHIMEGQPRELDVGEFNGRTFVYTASCGMFTKASYETPQKYKNVLGHFAYILEGMKDLPSTQAMHMRILAEGNVYEDNYLFVTICNTFSLGGIMTLDKDQVLLDDGLFEMLLISKPHDLLQLNNIINCLREHRYDSPNITLFRTDQATISCSKAPDWSLDGEKSVGVVMNRFSVIPGGIKMLY